MATYQQYPHMMITESPHSPFQLTDAWPIPNTNWPVTASPRASIRRKAIIALEGELRLLGVMGYKANSSCQSFAIEQIANQQICNLSDNENDQASSTRKKRRRLNDNSCMEVELIGNNYSPGPVREEQLRIARESARQHLIALRLMREDQRGHHPMDVENTFSAGASHCEHYYCSRALDIHIPDEDRVIVNEAIREGLDLNFIEILLRNYPRACESGGIVDHIDHPLHNACKSYRKAVPAILRFAPHCANQRDVNGVSAIELFLSNVDPNDITNEELVSTINLLCEMDSKKARQIISKRGDCFLQELLSLRGSITSLSTLSLRKQE